MQPRHQMNYSSIYRLPYKEKLYFLCDQETVKNLDTCHSKSWCREKSHNQFHSIRFRKQKVKGWRKASNIEKVYIVVHYQRGGNICLQNFLIKSIISCKETENVMKGDRKGRKVPTWTIKQNNSNNSNYIFYSQSDENITKYRQMGCKYMRKGTCCHVDNRWKNIHVIM